MHHVRRFLLRKNQQGMQGAVPKMKISEIGGEFAFIKRVTGVTYDDPAIVCGVGDDCAVLEYDRDRYLLVTTDMMVEGTHFSPAWCSPFQIGKKLMEVNVSDIVAMAGTPRWALISLALTPDTQVEFMDEFYRGLYDSAARHGVALIGGSDLVEAAARSTAASSTTWTATACGTRSLLTPASRR